MLDTLLLTIGVLIVGATIVVVVVVWFVEAGG
jgi:hypothetical protein